jgi:hypothetical protein
MLKTFAALALAVSMGSAIANNPQDSIKQLDERLGKIGAAKIDGTAQVADKTVAALFFGARRINNNFDVVDEIRKSTGASATVFVKEGEEFIRVSTNVLTPEGKRGIGTPLARNKAYEALAKGQSYCGVIDVLGTQFDACYNPIKDGAGKVIGSTYVGHKK